MPQTVTIRVYHTAYSIFTLYSHKVSILVANVYVYNLEEWLLRGKLLPCYKIAEKRHSSSVSASLVMLLCKSCSRPPGPVVQSIVSLTTSLRCQFVQHMPSTLSNTLLFFVGKCENLLHCKRFLHFSNKK